MTPTLRRTRLGSSDLEVSEVCLGTMTFGKQCTEEKAFEMLDYALEQGVNFLDTAEMYPVPPDAESCGQTEIIIGRWLKSRGCRDKVIIATKIAGPGRRWVSENRSNPPDPNAPDPCLSAQQINTACDTSLRRLGIDTIDLYQLHWPDRYVPLFGDSRYHADQERPSVPFEETVGALGKLIRAGKIRYWGVSNETTFGVCQLCEAAKKLGVPLPVSIQNDFSLVDRRFQSELAETCSPRHYNIGLIPYGPLAGGTLTGKYLNGLKPDGARHTIAPMLQPRYHAEPTMQATQSYADLAKSKGLTPTQLALAWCKSLWFVPSTIIGATSMQQLKENIEAFAIYLDNDTLRAIDAIHVRQRNPNVHD